MFLGLVPGTGTKEFCVKTLDTQCAIKYRVHISLPRDWYSSNRILTGMCPKQWCGYVSVHLELHSTTILGDQV